MGGEPCMGSNEEEKGRKEKWEQGEKNTDSFVKKNFNLFIRSVFFYGLVFGQD